MNNNNSENVPFAVLCCHEADEPHALELCRFLHRFQLPVRLQKAYPDLRQNLRPVIFSKDAVAPDGAFAARFLVVVCSPQAAADGSVETELRSFIAAAPEWEKRVIAVSWDLTEKRGAGPCLPPSLRRREMHVADVAAKGEDRAFHDIAAKMLGLQPEELWNWWILSLRRRRRRRFASLAVPAFLASVAGAWYWYDNTEHYSYYVDYTQVRHVPRGVGKLSRKQLMARSEYYRLTTLHGQVCRVECVGSNGSPARAEILPGREDRPISMKLHYREDGSVAEVECLDISGNVVQRQSVSPDGTYVVFRSVSEGGADAGIGSAALFRSNMTELGSDSASNIERYRLEFDRNGYVRAEWYADASGTPVKNTDGVWGKRYERDASGRVVAMHFMDEHAAPAEDVHGIATVVYKFDRWGNVCMQTFYAADGKRASYLNGISQTCTVGNEYGHILQVVFRDVNGAPCYSADGFVSSKRTYDARGYCTDEYYFDAQEQPVCNSEGAVHSHHEYDEAGNPVKSTLYDREGRKTASVEGVAEVQHRFGKPGQLLAEFFYGTDGKPCVGRQGYAGLEIEYGAGGREVAERYVDVNHRPCKSVEGYAEKRLLRDRTDRITGIAFFDETGAPCAGCGTVSRAEIKLDEWGNRSEERYYGIDGSPCKGPDGCEMLRATYNEARRMLFVEFCNADGSLCGDVDGIARVVYDYDAQGRCTGVANYNKQKEKICPARLGYAAFALTYDAAGNKNSISYYDENGNLCLSARGYARRVEEFDAVGKSVSATLYGPDEKLVKGPEGWAVMKYENNGIYHQCSRAFLFDEFGAPCPLAEIRNRYDKRGNLTMRRYYSAQGNLCAGPNGYAAMSKSYDEKGREVLITYFGADGKILSSPYFPTVKSVEYDEAGRKCRMTERYTDSEAHLKNSAGLFAVCVAHLDRDGRVIRMEYYDKNSKLCNRLNGGAVQFFEYTAAGVLRKVAERDKNGILLRVQAIPPTHS